MLDVFGDESAGEEYISYGLVCVPTHQAAELGESIADLKTRYGLAALHCRVLFSPNQRAKAGLDLTTPAVIAIYEELLALLGLPDIRMVVSQGYLPDLVGYQPADEHFPRMKFDKKSLGVMCANAAILPVKRDFSGMDVRIWPDADRTLADHLGKRQQASKAIGGFYGLPGMRDERVSPTPESEMPADARQELFAVADLIAWLANRVCTSKDSNLHSRFKGMFAKLSPMMVPLVQVPGQGMSFNVPYEWPVRPLRTK